MRPDISISELRPGEEESISQLVMRVFSRHVGHEYAGEGVAEFAKYAAAKAIRTRCDAGTSSVLVARAGDRPVGMVEFRGSDHVALLFVADPYQRRGIARGLFDAARSRLRSEGDITVNSSRYAVPVYERLGFVVAGVEQTVNGITFVPMRYTRSADYLGPNQRSTDSRKPR